MLELEQTLETASLPSIHPNAVPGFPRPAHSPPRGPGASRASLTSAARALAAAIYRACEARGSSFSARPRAVSTVAQVPRPAVSQGRRHVDAGWAWVLGSEGRPGARVKVPGDAAAGPSGGGHRSPAHGGPGDAGGRGPGRPARLTLAAAEISQPSLPRKLAAVCWWETASAHLGRLFSRSDLSTRVVGSNGGPDTGCGNPDWLFHFSGPQLPLVKKRRLGQQNLFRQWNPVLESVLNQEKEKQRG